MEANALNRSNYIVHSSPLNYHLIYVQWVFLEFFFNYNFSFQLLEKNSTCKLIAGKEGKEIRKYSEKFFFILMVMINCGYKVGCWTKCYFSYSYYRKLCEHFFQILIFLTRIQIQSILASQSFFGIKYLKSLIGFFF